MGIATASGQCVLAPPLGCFNQGLDLMKADNGVGQFCMCSASRLPTMAATLTSEECLPLLSFTMNMKQPLW